jgi:hypothetical protein
MRRGVPVHVYLKDEPLTLNGTITKYSNGIYHVKTDKGNAIKSTEANLYPVSPKHFLEQQVQIISQLHHFSSEFGLFLNTNKFLCEEVHKFYPECTTALEKNGHYCGLYRNWLALYRNSYDDIPYAYLKRSAFVCSSCDPEPITLEYNEKKSLEDHKDNDFIYVFFQGVLLSFENKKHIYSLDMGVMYLYMEHVMFQEVVENNCQELAIIQKDEKEFEYDVFNRCLFLKSQDTRHKHKVVGFNKDIFDFLIWRKLSFTIDRHHVFTSQEFK